MSPIDCRIRNKGHTVSKYKKLNTANRKNKHYDNHCFLAAHLLRICLNVGIYPGNADPALLFLFSPPQRQNHSGMMKWDLLNLIELGGSRSLLEN